MITIVFSFFQVPSDATSYTMAAIDGASIILTVEGSASCSDGSCDLEVQKGSVLFLAAGEQLTFNVKSEGLLLMFRAYCQL